jgi:hypothetical protein
MLIKLSIMQAGKRSLCPKKDFEYIIPKERRIQKERRSNQSCQI